MISRKPHAEGVLMSTQREIFLVDVVETKSVRLQIEAADCHEAMKLADEKASVKGFAHGAREMTVIGAWPLGEPEDAEPETFSNLCIRRGWWIEVRLDARSIAFRQGDLPGDFLTLSAKARETCLAGMAGLRLRNETVFGVTRVYGWACKLAASEGCVWDEVWPDRGGAIKSIRKRLGKEKEAAAREAQRVAYEKRLDEADIWCRDAQAWQGVFFRTHGGRWTTSNHLDGKLPQKVKLDKGFFEHDVLSTMINLGYVVVTKRFMRSGDPYEAELTSVGWLR